MSLPTHDLFHLQSLADLEVAADLEIACAWSLRPSRVRPGDGSHPSTENFVSPVQLMC